MIFSQYSVPEHNITMKISYNIDVENVEIKCFRQNYNKIYCKIRKDGIKYITAISSLMIYFVLSDVILHDI